MTADGNGAVSGFETFQVYGAGTQTLAFQGSYMVRSDGTGVLTLNFAAPVSNETGDEGGEAAAQPLTRKYNFMIVNAKGAMRATRAENGTLATAEFVRQ